MKIDVVTLFPKMFESPFAESMIKRAIDNNILKLEIHQMRQWAWNNYGAVDDRPYGGDVGMLIRPDVIFKALEDIKKANNIPKEKQRIILTSARGKRFDQQKAEELAGYESLVFVCGHYEGFDQRITDSMVDEEISIGDYVLTGGELPTMVMIDAVSRLVPGVLGKDESSKVESFSERELDGQIIRTTEHPQYTRPAEFMGQTVPEVLLSGDPKKIRKWQEEIIRKEAASRK